jgi:hypothetical protein
LSSRRAHVSGADDRDLVDHFDEIGVRTRKLVPRVPRFNSRRAAQGLYDEGYRMLG